jgi:hypothetical protein
MARRAQAPQATPPRDPPTDGGPGADPRQPPPPQEGPSLILGQAFVRTVRHFFPDLNDWLQELPDTRDPDACTYETRFLVWWGLALYLCQLRSRRQLNFKLDARGTHVLDNLNRLAGTQQPTRPVHGTLDHFLGHVAPGAFADLRARLVRHLIRSKALEPARLQGYLVAALDGTGLYAFRRRHCDG